MRAWVHSSTAAGALGLNRLRLPFIARVAVVRSCASVARSSAPRCRMMPRSISIRRSDGSMKGTSSSSSQYTKNSSTQSCGDSPLNRAIALRSFATVSAAAETFCHSARACAGVSIGARL